MKKSLFILLLAVFFISSSSSWADLSKKEVKKIPIAKFRIGMKENEIPNENVHGDLFNSPGGLYSDSKDNIYIFVQGLKQIRKFSSQGKFIEVFDLNKFIPNFVSVFLDKETDRIYVLTYQEIYIFDCDFNLEKVVNIEILHKKTNVDKIRVYKDNIFLYQGDFDVIYSFNITKDLDNRNIIKTYKKEENFIINNDFVTKANQSKEFGKQKYIFYDNKGKLQEVYLPKDCGFANFITANNSHLYLNISFSSPYNATLIYHDILIIDKSLNSFVINLQENTLPEGNNFPLICIDNKGNILHLKLENDFFILYNYQIF